MGLADPIDAKKQYFTDSVLMICASIQIEALAMHTAMTIRLTRVCLNSNRHDPIKKPAWFDLEACTYIIPLAKRWEQPLSASELMSSWNLVVDWWDLR